MLSYKGNAIVEGESRWYGYLFDEDGDVYEIGAKDLDTLKKRMDEIIEEDGGVRDSEGNLIPSGCFDD